MTVFAEYAEYYDLFYRDKDYSGEAAFVRSLVRRRSPLTRTVLELGCGTARHALELVRNGFAVTGVDLSTNMVQRGNRAAAELPSGLRKNLKIVQGDVTTFQASSAQDAVISLFHVVNYQTTNEALAGMFHTARQAVRKGGLFVFDFWYGPAVLSDRPSVRIKRVSTPSARVTRLAEPSLHENRNVVDVTYTLFVEHVPSGRMKEFKETHSMRYLFLPEIEMLAKGAGFKVVEVGEWLTRRKLNDGTWLGYAVARAA